ncbi:MAG: YlzJ-like family protein [Dethiobacteria bacterium]|jgi:hypothetical protein
MKGSEEHRPVYFQIPFNRGFIEVEITSNNSAKIVRLNSSDLNDYLHPALQPGKEIRLKWDIVQ